MILENHHNLSIKHIILIFSQSTGTVCNGTNYPRKTNGGKPNSRYSGKNFITIPRTVITLYTRKRTYGMLKVNFYLFQARAYEDARKAQRSWVNACRDDLDTFCYAYYITNCISEMETSLSEFISCKLLRYFLTSSIVLCRYKKNLRPTKDL